MIILQDTVSKSRIYNLCDGAARLLLTKPSGSIKGREFLD
jgi:hypothetical protein